MSYGPVFDIKTVYTHVIKSDKFEGYYCGNGFTTSIRDAFKYRNKTAAEQDIGYINDNPDKDFGNLSIGYISCNHYGQARENWGDKEIPENELKEYIKSQYTRIISAETTNDHEASILAEAIKEL